ncbi:MAG: TlpA family protein disulfide reductase [Prevotella sp.]|nr:TlpA family protein disulfide reductase [Prevotella sp.]MDY4040223.1 TlpA disulfide reductase family protein [Prevotella sp.]
MKSLLAGALLLFAASANAQSAQELQLQLDLNDVSDTLILSRLPFGSNHSEGCDTIITQRGRYVILDFWGSWCGSCIKGMPKMKEYYARYKDRFEIVGVDCSDTEAKWKAAVKEHALPWIHVFNGPTDGVDTRYAVNVYPTKILINPDGTINRVIVGESEEFYQYLDQLFKT